MFGSPDPRIMPAVSAGANGSSAQFNSDHDGVNLNFSWLLSPRDFGTKSNLRMIAYIMQGKPRRREMDKHAQQKALRFSFTH
jgi:hypothetical protein